MFIRKPSWSILLCSSTSPVLNNPDSSLPSKTDMNDGNDPDIIELQSASIMLVREKEEERLLEGEYG